MKYALVTGGSRGIGFGIAEHLANEGWHLIINGMRPEAKVSETLDALREKGVQVAYAPGDIGSAEDRHKILSAAHDFAGGALNLLVNNAGVAPKERLDILETTEENYDRVVDINLKGVFFLTQAVANRMIKARRENDAFNASIINIGSISATVVSINRGEYCIAKAGMGMVTRLFAARLGEAGIPVYEIRPGITKTDMTSAVTEKYDRLIEQGLCVNRRWGYPEDVAKAAVALAGGDFPYSTGQVIMVDGGLTIPRL